MSDREKARESIMKHVRIMENDNVLRSICLIIGDYVVSENGEERAGYITAILLNIIRCENSDNLSKIYTVAKTLAEIEAEKAV